MAIQRKSDRPVGITNESGQPEIVLELDGLTLSMKPPSKPTDATSTDAVEEDPKADGH